MLFCILQIVLGHALPRYGVALAITQSLLCLSFSCVVLCMGGGRGAMVKCISSYNKTPHIIIYYLRDLFTEH